MENIHVEVGNPDEIKLKVTATFTVTEWGKLLDLARRGDLPHSGPLCEFASAVRAAIAAIRKREECLVICDLHRQQCELELNHVGAHLHPHLRIVDQGCNWL